MKRFLSLAAATLITLSLAGCSGASNHSSSRSAYSEAAASSAAPMPSENYYSGKEAAYDEMAVEDVAAQPAEGGTDTGSASLNIPANNGRKIIWTVNMDLETLEFDETLETLNRSIDASGGYAQNSSVNGTSLRGHSGQRHASLTARIPQDKLTGFIDEVNSLCNVVSVSSSAEDVSEQYTDTEMRKRSLEVEQDRLLALLEKADSLEAVVALEARLSEVRYQLDSLTSTLRGLDSKIDYSTIYLELYEVQRVSDPTPHTLSQRIQTGFSGTLYDLKTGTQDLFVDLVVNLPYLIIWAVIIFILVLVVRLILRRLKRHAAALPKGPLTPPAYGGKPYQSPEQKTPDTDVPEEK